MATGLAGPACAPSLPAETGQRVEWPGEQWAVSTPNAEGMDGDAIAALVNIALYDPDVEVFETSMSRLKQETPPEVVDRLERQLIAWYETLPLHSDP